MKVIYVAGKYRGDSAWETYYNIHLARLAAWRLWNEGWAAICPHSNTAFFDGGASFSDYNKWLQGDLEILRRCDAIYMLRGWDKSEGARQEWELAKELGLEFHYEGDREDE